VPFSQFFCDDAQLIDQNTGAGTQTEASNSTGYYIGKVGRYRSGGGVADSKRWWNTNKTASASLVVDCQADRGVHGFLAGDAAIYTSKIAGLSGNARWTSDVSKAYDWSSIGTSQHSTGNYLNYLIVTKVNASYRIQVIRNAMMAFVDSASNINLGFMPFSRNTINGGRSEGGMVEVAVDDIKITRDDIKARLQVYGTRHNYNDTSIDKGHNNLIFGTPSSRQYYEALRYFKGDAPVYGATAKAPSLTASSGCSLSPLVPSTGLCADDPDGTGPLKTATDTVSFPSVADSMQGANYKSPIVNECQKNFVVILTDGAAYADPIDPGQLTEMGITDIGCTDDANCVNKSCQNSCLPKFAEAGAILSKTNNLSEVQPISTFTIGFDLNPNSTAATNLSEASSISKKLTNKGESFLANNASELTQNLVTIAQAFDTTATFSSPAVSVNAFNRSVHLDNLFFTLFAPDEGAHWDGNIKKYKLGILEDVNGPILDADGRKQPIIVDLNGASAINSASGFFDDNARSYWSSTVDGAKIIEGGAVDRLAARSDERKIYTYTGAYNTKPGGVEVPVSNNKIITDDNRIESDNTANVTGALLGISETDTVVNGKNATVSLHETLLDWASGLDVLDQFPINDVSDPADDGNGKIDDARAVMGDPLHAQPGIIQYGGSLTNPILVAYVATNDGYLHAINTETGKELWAFIPQELLPLLNTNFENAENGIKSYGLDGNVVALIDDVNNDGTITVGTDRVILYFGQRRGGSNIYALDVTDREDPSLLWVIKGGVAGTDYAELGQTWSTVNVEKVKNGTKPDGTVISKDVLIFGGGYDTRHDNDDITVLPRVAPSAPLDTARDDSVGRTVFIADAISGKMLWSAGKGGENTTNMDYSIAARVKPLDISGDGNIDRLYVADLGGQIFRFDIDETTASFDADEISGGRFADLSKDGSLVDARRFYYPPDVALVAQKGKAAYLGLAISSGYRAHPNNLDIQDRIYLLKDRNVFEEPDYSTAPLPLTEANLYDATDNLASLPENPPPTGSEIAAAKTALGDLVSAEGWYIKLDNEATPPLFVGEKGLAEPLIIEGNVIVTTFVPAEKGSTGSNACAPQEGSGKVFYLDILDATASFPSDIDSRPDRHIDLKKGGIPASPNVIITDNGVPTNCIGTECESLGGITGAHRTFWYEVEK